MQNINQSFPFSPFMNFNNWSSWPQPSNKLAICFPTKYDLGTKVRDHIPQPEWKMPQITGLQGVFLCLCVHLCIFTSNQKVLLTAISREGLHGVLAVKYCFWVRSTFPLTACQIKAHPSRL